MDSKEHDDTEAQVPAQAKTKIRSRCRGWRVT